MSNSAQRSFSKGEISPALYARADLTAYATGLRTCRNFIVRRTGGLDNRPGTDLVGTAPGAIVRLIPFVFNDAQTYVLEFTASLVRVIRNGAYLAGVSVVTPYAAADLASVQFTQTADIITLTHPSYPVAELRRTGATTWTYAAVVFGASIAPPTNVALVPPGSGTFNQWVVTAVDATTGQESIASAVVGVASIELPIARTITWTPVANAKEYRVYKGGTPDGTTATDFGFVGSTGTVCGFYDNNLTADRNNRVTFTRSLFAAAGDYPGAVGFYQQRRILAGATNTPERVHTSRTADFKNFSTSSPTQDDDAITFGLVSKKVNQIKHILDAAELLLFTSGGEWVVRGDGAGILRPTDVNALQFSQHGCSDLAPIQIGSRVLFVQARQAIVRDLSKDYYYGYRGNDLTIFSGHLFDGHTIVDWCYQEVPHSIIWCVRDDGVLLGLTDVAEQEVSAWHRHDTLGTVTACCVVPEGGEDRLYLAVERNGATAVERMASRLFTDIEDAIFTDSTLSYDGRNTTAATMTLSGGTDWTFDELLTCTCSASEFTALDVGNAVFLDGTSQVRFTIAGYTSALVVTGYAQMTVPGGLRGVATSAWSRAVDVVTGLDHLEGLDVSVVADGYVVANPNNPACTTVCTVSGGSITLDRPYAYIHAGLPYVSDLQTLDVDSPSGPSLKASKRKIDKIIMEVTASRGLYAGSGEPADDATIAPLFEMKLRNMEDYSTPVSMTTGTLEPVSISNSWSRDGRAFVRQVDPMPCSILAVILQSV